MAARAIVNISAAKIQPLRAITGASGAASGELEGGCAVIWWGYFPQVGK